MLPTEVTVKEVGPRDGLQNESKYVGTSDKVELIERLANAGCRHIEATSFVNPQWIPALADATEVLSQLKRRKDVQYSALVPNERGLERALRAKVDAVNVFLSASETHNQKNVNKSIANTLITLVPVIEGAKTAGLPVRGYVSTVFGCPYEGSVPVSKVMSICERLLELGVDEVSLGDTIGVAVPSQITEIVSEVATIVPLSMLALHLHDTRGTAMANVYAGMLCGVKTFDSSIGGIGGCPYAPGATGNIATDDLLYMLDRMNIHTGIDSVRLQETAQWFENVLQKSLPSHARAVARSCERVPRHG